jgi:CheY-like chemotaxis protein
MSIRVLYVEDDPDIQEIAALALHDLGGMALTVCSSGMEAVAAFPTSDAQLILLDVMMPSMDGPSTLEALRKLPGGEAIPVVFMTAKVQSHEVPHYKALGAVGVISKPFDPMTLAQQVLEFYHQGLDRR